MPEVDTTIVFGERFGAQTAGSSSSVVVDIRDNLGTVAYGGRGPMPAFIYDVNTVPAVTDQTLFSGLGIEAGAWFPFWLYCDPAGRLVRLYGERTDAPGAVDVALDGTCTRTEAYNEVPVRIPAHALSRVAMTCGFEVSTPPVDTPAVPLELGSSRPGSVNVWGETAVVLVFNTVDCRTGCGPDGAFELHSILWDHVLGTVGFVIWYLWSPDHSVPVFAANSLLLPDATAWSFPFPYAIWTLPR